MSHAVSTAYGPIHHITEVREVPWHQPVRWLGAGWRDLRAAPLASLSYGLGIVVASYLLTLGLLLNDAFYLLLPLLAGFLLIAPLLAVGLYDISRRLERRETPQLRQALVAWRQNGAQIAAMGVVLMLVLLAWLMLANLVFGLLFRGITPTLGDLPSTVLLSIESPGLLVVGTAIGVGIAAFAFATSAVSIPMLLARPVDAYSAVLASWAAVRYNWRPMVLWAGLIVVITFAGLITLYVGLVVALPVLGHATWHAYRELVV